MTAGNYLLTYMGSHYRLCSLKRRKAVNMQRTKVNINVRVHKHWLIADRKVLENTKLSPVSRLVYYFLQGWNSQYELSNKKLGEKLGFSESSITRATKELKDVNLYYVDRIGAKKYKGYLGSTDYSAKKLFLRTRKEEL